MSRLRGFIAEKRVKHYLCKQGLALIKSNYNCRLGEIDLIMRHKDAIVFVEVRQRRSMGFGLAAETVNHQKQQKLIKAATHFLMTHPRYENSPMRFDVVCLDGTPPTVSWIQDAFSLDY